MKREIMEMGENLERCRDSTKEKNMKSGLVIFNFG